MPQVISTTVYTFEELSDSAKEEARDWYREDGFDYDWWDSTFENAYTIAALMGLDIQPAVKNDPRGINFELHIQGSGACFTGRYRPVKNAEAAVREHAPLDETLHSLARILDEDAGQVRSQPAHHRQEQRPVQPQPLDGLRARVRHGT